MVSEVQVRAHLATLLQRPEVGGNSGPITTRGRPCPGNLLLSPREGWVVPTAQRLGISHWLWVTFAIWCLVLWHGEALLRVAKLYFGRVKKCGACVKDVVRDSLGVGASRLGFRFWLPLTGYVLSFLPQFPHLSQRLITGTTT